MQSYTVFLNVVNFAFRYFSKNNIVKFAKLFF